jgi:ADP-ribosylglycohydrolase
MAMGLAQSIIDGGSVDGKRIACEYNRWYKSGPFDIGNSTRHCVQKSSEGEMIKAAQEFDQDCITKHGDHNLSNGFIMRIAPLGIVVAGMISSRSKFDDAFIKKIVDIVHKDTRLTHPSIEALGYAVSFVLMIGFGIVDGKLDRGIQLSLKYLKKRGDWYKILQAGLRPESKLAHDPKKMMGDVRIAYQLAVRKASMVQQRVMTFPEAIVSTVKLGGDTDTNACIVGYLCGAVGGKIPDGWTRTIIIGNPITERRKNFPPLALIDSVPGLADRLLQIGGSL